MAIILALVSALAYGAADFFGGLLGRRMSSWQVAVVSMASAFVFLLPIGLLAGGSPSTSDYVWAGFGGLLGGAGIAFLYRGLASGRMGVVGPVSGVGTAVIPVAAGLALGERPSVLVLVGMALALPAIWLTAQVPEGSDDHLTGLLDGALAGIGFGGIYVCLGQVGDDAGMGPLTLLQFTSIVGVVILAIAMRGDWVPSRASLSAVWLGPLVATAIGLFQEATRHGLLAVVSVIGALYPAATVLLAAVVLRERIHRVQGVGLAIAAVAVGLVAAG